MVVWLRRDSGDGHGNGGGAGFGIGADDGVIRAGQRARLLELDAAWQALQQQRDAVLAEARREADGILAEASTTAADLLRQANQRADSSARLGYAAGQRRALAQFHASMAERAYDEMQSAERAQARLLDIVMQTVERVLLESDREALFARVAATLSRVVRGQARLTVRVHAGERAQACAAFDQALRGGALTVPFEVVADDGVQPGHCVCEWDHGVVDAGLPVQLAALRQALARVARDAGSARHARHADDGDGHDGGHHHYDQGSEAAP